MIKIAKELKFFSKPQETVLQLLQEENNTIYDLKITNIKENKQCYQ